MRAPILAEIESTSTLELIVANKFERASAAFAEYWKLPFVARTSSRTDGPSAVLAAANWAGKNFPGAAVSSFLV